MTSKAESARCQQGHIMAIILQTGLLTTKLCNSRVNKNTICGDSPIKCGIKRSRQQRNWSGAQCAWIDKN